MTFYNLEKFKAKLSHSERYLFQTQADKSLAYDEQLFLHTIVKELHKSQLPVTKDSICYVLWKIHELNDVPITLNTIRKAIK